MKTFTFSKTTMDNFLAFFRIVVSFLMINGHGLPKILKFFNGEELKFADPIGIGIVPSLVLATFAEFFCSIMIIIGFKTRLATLPLIVTMFVVIFIVDFSSPIQERETAILYFLSYGVILFLGPGKYALDNVLKKK
ncbi:MAG: DoxX family protein [Saprospiraceae bacterium]|jgi:putative oxidoreductase|nr:DoxX family protein [Saprospiraceae bacterium]MBX7178328.1 DoxX family protein [Saprospiraceae bacterium]MCB0591583.1 DoxX family protein [Saprospiraceae bacterium]MCO5283270.1 DoxX family protein [Saprospiraceae bacterium]MCO6471559.1 DoxX family protein [Saprospiraceae bacterium]